MKLSIERSLHHCSLRFSKCQERKISRWKSKGEATSPIDSLIILLSQDFAQIIACFEAARNGLVSYKSKSQKEKLKKLQNLSIKLALLLSILCWHRLTLSYREREENIFSLIICWKIFLRTYSWMRKFTPFSNPSCFKKYAINGPTFLNSRQKRKEVTPQSSSRIENTKDNGQNIKENILVQTVQRANSIRSSVGRMKSGKLDRTEIINKQMTKTTLRRQRRFNTQQKEGNQDKRINGLKKYVNQLNITCNRVIKGEEDQGKQASIYTLQERKKLKTQTCFTEINEERVLSQKKYLKKFQHLAKSLPKMTETDFVSRENEDCILTALRTIDRIYVSIRNTSNKGYLHRNNKFLVDYCMEGRVWLKTVFLLETSAKKQAFTMAVKYTVVPTPEQAKRRLTDFIAKSQGEDIKMVLCQVQGLFQHIQHCLTQKKITKLMNITTEIDNWMKAQPNPAYKLRFSQTTQAQLRLTQDLQSLQAQFGPMRQISKISRRKYDQLNRTYDRLQSYI